MASFINLLFYIAYFWISYTISKTHCLDANGCEDGWFNFKEHCYKVVITETTTDEAKSGCQALGAELASVWSEAEKSFLVSHWQFPRRLLGFMWLGLRGTPENSWKHDDRSPLTSSSSQWSILKDVEGEPASTDNQCVALRPTSTVAFLDCTMDASAYVCKKALPKVYITPGVSNRTQLPAATLPLNHAQMFRRMYPPRLTSFPGTEAKLAEINVDDDIGCAYKCFSINSCMIFQVSCHTKTRCASYRCILFTHVPGFV